MAHTHYLNELIKEYLLFKGFTTTLRSLDTDLKNDKDQGFRAHKITDQILNYIHTYDLNGLREIWSHLDRRVYGHLSLSLQPCVKKFETSILKLYVINTLQTSKPDKLFEFFEKMSSELQNQLEWKDWFVLPYLKNVEENPTYSIYFTRHWQDTLFVSLQNFLSVIFQNMQLPTLASFLDESKKINELLEENENLKAKLHSVCSCDQLTMDQIPIPKPLAPTHLMDDFFSISQESTTTDAGVKSLKNILFGLGSGFPPQSSRPTRFQQAGHGQGRRTSSQAPPDERRRQRSSSVAPASSHGNEITSPAPGNNTRSLSKQRLSSRSNDDVLDADPAPFLLLSQEYYKEHRSVVSHTVFNHSCSLVASADTDGVVKLWTPSPIMRTECNVLMNDGVSSLEWLPKSERYLFIASKHGAIKLYDSQDRKTNWDLSPDASPLLRDIRILCAKVSASENSFFVSTSAKGAQNFDQIPNVLLFDFRSQGLEKSVRLDGIINTFAVNHNGSLLICGCTDGKIRLVDVRRYDVVDSWVAHQGEVLTLKLSFLEDKIYSVGTDNKFAVWSLVPSGKILKYTLSEKAMGPFREEVSSDKFSSDRRFTPMHPFGSLFALHQDSKRVFICSQSGPVVYKIDKSNLIEEMKLGGHLSSVVTLDWNLAMQCGFCVAASVDGQISVSTLLPQ